jgi:hypothetical protein
MASFVAAKIEQSGAVESLTCLTTRCRLATFVSVFTSGIKKWPNVRRFVGAGLLLFVFLLPFHFHFSATAQVSKECSCVHGNRTQLALTAEISTCVPTLQTIPFIAQNISSWADEWANLQKVRGPPAPLSV